MLPPLPTGDMQDQRYRVMGIDPGSDTLGIAILELDVLAFTTTLLYATTLKASRELKHVDTWLDQYGGLETKINCHRHFLARHLTYFHPNSVISESPFLGRFPRAFEALVLCLSMIRQSVREYDPFIELEVVDPPTAKKAVGASGRGGDKDAVRYAVMQHPKIQNASGFDYDYFDEHAIDAIAVAAHKVNRLCADYLKG